MTRQSDNRRPCTECGKPVHARGLCYAHYREWRDERDEQPSHIPSPPRAVDRNRPGEEWLTKTEVLAHIPRLTMRQLDHMVAKGLLTTKRTGRVTTRAGHLVWFNTSDLPRLRQAARTLDAVKRLGLVEAAVTGAVIFTGTETT